MRTPREKDEETQKILMAAHRRLAGSYDGSANANPETGDSEGRESAAIMKLKEALAQAQAALAELQAAEGAESRQEAAPGLEDAGEGIVP